MNVITSFILLCICLFNCLCEQIINISVDNDKPRDFNGNGDKNIQIEIRKIINKSHENIIPISSCSGSLEHYNVTVPQRQEQNPWILLRKGKPTIAMKNDSYTGRILSSNEETTDLWANKLKDSIHPARIRTEPEKDHIFHDKIHFSENFNEKNKPAALTRVYPEDPDIILKSIKNEQGFKPKELMKPKTLPKKLHNQIPIIRMNPGNMWKKTLRNHSDNILIEQKNKLKSQEEIWNIQLRRFSNKFHNEIPIIPINTRNAWRKTFSNYCTSENILKSDENSRNDNVKKELLDVLHVAKAKRERRTRTEREKPTLVARNSTIEDSDHEYQENKNSEEDNDQESFNDYPYSASVQRKGAHYASGALIGERWILSSAAEFYNVRETIKLFRVRVGSVDCKRGGILTPVKTIGIHPKFTPGRPAYDVSVLKTVNSLISSIATPIGLSRVAEDVPNAKFVTTYWPRIVVKHGVVRATAKERFKYNSMRVSTQKVVPTDMCRQLMANFSVILDKNSLCLRPVKIYHSDCMPDAGAPIVSVDGLWGVTSGWVSPQCPTVILPTIFTRVTKQAVRTWIYEQMKL